MILDDPVRIVGDHLLYTPVSNTPGNASERNVGVLKGLHEVAPDRPHACPLAINIHGNAKQQTAHLDGANGDENAFATVGLEPVREEE